MFYTDGMKNVLGRGLALAAAVALLPACDPETVPRYSADGREVAFLRDGDPEKGPAAVGVADLASGKLRSFALPERWSASGLVWAGSRLLIFSTRPTDKLDKKGKPVLESASWLLDPATGAVERSGIDYILGGRPFHGIHHGTRCLYVPEMERLRILELPGLKERAVLPIRVEHAGDGWMLVEEGREAQGGLTRELVAVRILDPEGKEAGRIPREEVAKASYRDARSPECARVSEDHRRVLLGFDTSTIFRQADAEYTFGVFDLQTGKHLFGGKSNALQGIPVLLGEAVYVLEAKARNIYTGERGVGSMFGGGPPRSEPTSDVVLARHDKDGRRAILELPLGKDKATRYSASDDRSRFVLQVDGPAPRLLLIPIAAAVTADQVKELR